MADQISRKLNAPFTPASPSNGYGETVMRGAFVLQLGAETKTKQNCFCGRIEEVDTGRELRFRSTEELLEFLAKCFCDANQGDLKRQQPKEDL